MSQRAVLGARALLLLLLVLVPLGAIAADEVRETALADLDLDLSRLPLGERHYGISMSARASSGGKTSGTISFSGSMTLANRVSDDEVLIETRVEIMGRRFVTLFRFGSDSLLRPIDGRLESSMFPPAEIRFGAGEALVTGAGQERRIDIPGDMLIDVAAYRIVPMLPREPGVRYVFESFLESMELRVQRPQGGEAFYIAYQGIEPPDSQGGLAGAHRFVLQTRQPTELFVDPHSGELLAIRDGRGAEIRRIDPAELLAAIESDDAPGAERESAVKTWAGIGADAQTLETLVRWLGHEDCHVRRAARKAAERLAGRLDLPDSVPPDPIADLDLEITRCSIPEGEFPAGVGGQLAVADGHVYLTRGWRLYRFSYSGDDQGCALTLDRDFGGDGSIGGFNHAESNLVAAPSGLYLTGNESFRVDPGDGSTVACGFGQRIADGDDTLVRIDEHGIHPGARCDPEWRPGQDQPWPHALSPGVTYDPMLRLGDLLVIGGELAEPEPGGAKFRLVAYDLGSGAERWRAGSTCAGYDGFPNRISDLAGCGRGICALDVNSAKLLVFDLAGSFIGGLDLRSLEKSAKEVPWAIAALPNGELLAVYGDTGFARIRGLELPGANSD